MKKTDISCNLLLHSDNVAQVLREAHIVLQNRETTSLTFVLTNSIDWSFGVAKKYSNKIEVESTAHYNTSITDNLEKVYKYFQHIFSVAIEICYFIVYYCLLHV